MEFSPTMVGKPFTWHTLNYGAVHVHVKGFSPNGGVAILDIDAAVFGSLPGELHDGIGYAVEGQLTLRTPKRAVATRKPRGKQVARLPIDGKEIAF